MEFKSNAVSFTRADRDLRVQARAPDSSMTEVERSLLKHITVPEEKTPAESLRLSPVLKATDEDLTLSSVHEVAIAIIQPQENEVKGSIVASVLATIGGHVE